MALSLVDDIELDMFAEYGDPGLAQAVGLALRATFEMVGALCGFPADWMDHDWGGADG